MHAHRAQVKNQKERSPLAVMRSLPVPNSDRAPARRNTCYQSILGCANSTGTAAVMRTSGGLTW